MRTQRHEHNQLASRSSNLYSAQDLLTHIWSRRLPLTYPRMQPSSELIGALQIMYNGELFGYTVDWFWYAVYNDTTWDPATLSPRDYAAASRINPGNIQAWNGNLSPFRARGAKLLIYGSSRPKIARATTRTSSTP